MTDICEHGGKLDDAVSRYGGTQDDWCDLSTGINPFAYPFEMPDKAVLARLPDSTALATVEQHAASYYQISDTHADIMAVAGAQMAITLLGPFLARILTAAHPERPISAAILSPTYNEYEQCLKRAGMAISYASNSDALGGADLAVICSPNNPTGAQLSPEEIHQIARHATFVILDESFADTADKPAFSAHHLQADNVIILKSFGKFFGLAGLRLGFVIGSQPLIMALREHSGPWPISGMAIDIACQALPDTSWHNQTRALLRQLSDKMDKMAISAGLAVIGGTSLFRLYHCPQARQLQDHLAQRHIWSRCFSYAPDWIRLGIALPQYLARLDTAFTSWHAR